MINLVAVQAEMALEHYLSEATFQQKIFSLMEQATAALPEGPTLVAFPEIIGLPLILTLGATQQEITSLPAAVRRLLRRRWQRVISVRSPSVFRRLYAVNAVSAFDVYTRVFASASRTFGVTIVAGSIFLPTVDQEAARSLHIADYRPYNTAFTFAPTGRVLGRSHKIHLTPGLESQIGLSRGTLPELPVMYTPAGRVGVAICLDAFYTSVVDHLDGQGAQIVVQPSANHAPWSRPWPHETALTEGEAWLRYGLRQQLQARQNLHYGINPMLIGDLWGLVAEGRSSIVANTAYYPVTTEGYAGLVAIAPNAASEEVVRVTLPSPARGVVGADE
jgi:predicted amidohydrolase